MKHLVETTDWTDSEIFETLDLALRLKHFDIPPLDFMGKSLALLFFNPSLRTRVSFIRAMEQLGGSAIAMDAGKDTWKLAFEGGVKMDGDRVEHIREAIPVLGRYCNFLGVRNFGEMKDFAVEKNEPWMREVDRVTKVPFINLESAMAHPCQAFADVFTISRLKKKFPKILFTWVNHPKAVPMAVTHSFLLLASRMGWGLKFLRPKGYELDSKVMQQIKEFTKASRGSFEETDDREKAFEGANVVYAKSWTSIGGYGNPEEETKKKEGLQDWMVTQEKIQKTDDAVFMHCLPVRRNVEVTDDVLDSKASIVLDQAENRLHVQKAILCQLAKWNEVPGDKS